MGLFRDTFPESVPRFLSYEQKGNFNIVIDTKTGVNYALYSYVYIECDRGAGAGGLSPLYQADGNLIVTPQDELEQKIREYMNTPL